MNKKQARGFIVILLLIFSPLIYSQSLFKTLETSFKLDRENYPRLIQKFLNKNFKFSKIKDINDVGFHPYFLDNLLFNNSNEVLALAQRDECSLVDLLNTDLLYSSEGKLSYVLIQFANKDGSLETHSLPKNRYLNLIGYKKCPGSLKLKKYFNLKNLRKTLKTENMLFPKSLSECNQTHKEFINNVKAPYLCDITRKIENSDKLFIQLKNTSKSNFRTFSKLTKEANTTATLKKIVNPNALNLLSNLCKNTNNSTSYCEDIFADTYWSNSTKGLVSKLPLIGFCKNYLNKKKITKRDLKVCSNAFASNPTICESGLETAPSLTPMPNCRKISKALNHSRLYKEYKDCPNRIGQSALITTSRVIAHFDKAPMADFEDCELPSILPYAKFNQNFLENEFWKIAICYDDKIARKKTCLPTLLHQIKDSKMSLSYNVGKVLSRLRGFNNKDNSCKVINDTEYKPLLLEFKAGCFIIKDSKKCTSTKCPFKVVLDDRPFTNFKMKNSFRIDIFPYSYTEENRSMLRLFEKHYKKTSKKILNISSLKRVFSSKSEAIILAAGCLEDLLPTFRQHKLFNQCSFMPFIVDGIIESNSSHSLIVRTSLDHIHAPRIIPWSQVFSSVKNHQRFHPLKEWSFYALY